jgi:hypothetical protein
MRNEKFQVICFSLFFMSIEQMSTADDTRDDGIKKENFQVTLMPSFMLD